MNSDLSHKIERMLQLYGKALSDGDIQSTKNCWAVPSLVLSDQGAIAVTDLAQVEAFFSQVAGAYRSQGLMSTRPEVEGVEMLTERLVAVDVRWPAFDALGNETSSERSHYILQLGEGEQVQIRLALTRTR